jgi:hypothetical protein
VQTEKISETFKKTSCSVMVPRESRVVENFGSTFLLFWLLVTRYHQRQSIAIIMSLSLAFVLFLSTSVVAEKMDRFKVKDMVAVPDKYSSSYELVPHVDNCPNRFFFLSIF